MGSYKATLINCNVSFFFYIKHLHVKLQSPSIYLIDIPRSKRKFEIHDFNHKINLTKILTIHSRISLQRLEFHGGIHDKRVICIV